MPTYSYTDRRGRTIERVFPLGKHPESVTVGRTTYERNPAADHRNFHDTPSADVLISESMGVLPSQVAEATAHDAGIGLKGFEYLRDGRIKFQSKAARREWMLRTNNFNADPGPSDVDREHVRDYRQRQGIEIRNEEYSL